MAPAAMEVPATWWALVEARAGATPDRALLTDVDGRSLTCAGYRDACLDVAVSLRRLGIGPGSVVAWQLPTSIEAAVLISALACLGAVQNPLMPILRDSDLEPIFAQLRPDAFLVPAEWRGYDHAALAARMIERHGGRSLLCTIGGGGPWLGLPAGEQPGVARASAVAAATVSSPGAAPVRWVFYTSGTTGVPKGARHTDPSVMAASNSFVGQLLFGADDVLSLVFPIAHIGGPALLAAALRGGSSLVLAPTFDPSTTPRQLADHGVTMLGSAAPFFLAYLDAQQSHGPEPLYPRLRLCANGGAPPPADLFRRLYHELGVALHNGYGMTECPVVGYTPFIPGVELLPSDPMTPASAVEIICTGPDGQVLPPGEQGELRVRGPQLFSGYVGSPDPAKDLDERGYFRTGDLGVVGEDGTFAVTGRIKDVIIRNAENISATYVEDVLAGHPAIVEVALVGLPDPRTGERACAFVVQRPSARPLSLEDIAAFCVRSGLARYQIPEQLVLVDDLPRTPMGKVQKAILRERLLQESPRPEEVGEG